MLSRISTLAARSIARPLAASIKLNNKPVFVQSANFAVSSKVIASVSKNIKREVSAFTADLDDCSAELKEFGATATVTKEGDILIDFKQDKFDVSVKFNQEFEYDDDADQNNYNEREGDDVEAEEDADESAFHTVTTTLKGHNGVSLEIVGTLSLSGDYQIDSFLPIKDGVETRRITTTDMEQDTLDSVFDVLESAGINQEFSDLLVKYARYQRLNRHVEALQTLNEFVAGL